MQTDWETGIPPIYVAVDVFVGGTVRHGALAADGFHFFDCTDPLQNSICSKDSVEGWRYRQAEESTYLDLLVFNQRQGMINMANGLSFSPYSNAMRGLMSPWGWQEATSQDFSG